LAAAARGAAVCDLFGVFGGEIRDRFFALKRPGMTRAANPLLDDDFLRRIERLALISRKVLAGRMRGERRSRRRGTSVEFADYRDYAQGDDPRFIDWNIAGRLDRLFLKRFLEEEDLHVAILLDTSHSMAFGTPSKLAVAKKIAAALAYIAFCSHERASVLAFDRAVGSVFPLARGRRQIWRLFDFLDGLEAGGPTSIAAAGRRFAATRPGKGLVVVLSDFLDKAGFEEGLKYLAGPAHDVVVCHLLAPEEVDPPLEGDLRLVDIEDADAAEISLTQDVRRAYRRTLEAFRGRLVEECRRRGFASVFMTTDRPFDRLILGLLRSAGVVT
jgi:uncharacterized protein (DUF58 family)